MDNSNDDKGLEKVILNIVLSKLKNRDYDGVYVFEDNINNIRAIKNAVAKSGVAFKHTLIDESHYSSKGKLLIKELRRQVGMKIASL